mmetsp:Transcript_60092/g.127308  ORF Transcript_60092/g.127308 Transcript_60092/m.127308 type:complete len:416 (+) Transcript_60092:112-1359(+)
MATNIFLEEEGAPPAKKAKTTSLKEVLIKVKESEGHAEEYFDRAPLLFSDYFKDGLERWKPELEIPTFELVLPEGCSAPKGLKLLKHRLSEFRENDKAVAWSKAKWWRATEGDTTAFLSALYIFDHIMAVDIRYEVAEAMETFRVPCPEPFHSILRQTLPVEELSHQETRLPALKVDKKSLKSLLDCGITGNRNARALADRAIAACEAEFLVPLLWSRLRRVDFEVTNGPGMEVANWVYFHGEQLTAKSQNIARSWLRLVLQDVRARAKGYPESSLERAAAVAIEVVLNSFLLKLCRNKIVSEDQKESLKQFIADIIFQVEEIRSSIPNLSFDSCWDADVFEVAPAFVQLSILEALHAFRKGNGKKEVSSLFDTFKGKASTVAPEARHGLLPFVDLLNSEDIDFLHSASFPALES